MAFAPVLTLRYAAHLTHRQLDELRGAGAPAVLLLAVGEQASRQLQGISYHLQRWRLLCYHGVGMGVLTALCPAC
jgi:hypothetical protein